MIVKHTQREACTLLYFETFRQHQKLQSVLGDLWITVLVWITQPGSRPPAAIGITRGTPNDRSGQRYLGGVLELDEDDEIIDGAFIIYVKTCE